MTLSFLCLFTGQFVSDKEQLHHVAQMIIAVTVINFFLNGVPIVLTAVKGIIKVFKKCKKRFQKWQLAKMKLHMLRYRTPEEKEYGRKVSRRADLAADNVQAFAKFEI